LDHNLDLGRDLKQLEEDLVILLETAKNQREELIKLRVRDSELESKNKKLDEEEKAI